MLPQRAQARASSEFLAPHFVQVITVVLWPLRAVEVKGGADSFVPARLEKILLQKKCGWHRVKLAKSCIEDSLRS